MFPPESSILWACVQTFPKLLPSFARQRHPEIEPLLIHTGQLYAENLSNLFFRQMGIPEPHINLGVGSGTHSQQTAENLKRVEPILLEQQPDLVLVVGDDFPWFSRAGRRHLPSVHKLREAKIFSGYPLFVETRETTTLRNVRRSPSEDWRNFFASGIFRRSSSEPWTFSSDWIIQPAF